MGAFAPVGVRFAVPYESIYSLVKLIISRLFGLLDLVAARVLEFNSYCSRVRSAYHLSGVV